MKMKTIIKTSDNQLWFASLNKTYYSTMDLLFRTGNDPDIGKIEKEISRINNKSLSIIKLIPLSITNKTKFTNDRLSFRGYENDKTPFIYRQKALPEIEAYLFENDHKHRWINFHAYLSNYHAQLTDGAKKYLYNKYNDELCQLVNEKLLIECKKEAIEKVINYAKKEINNYRQQLDKLEAFNPQSYLVKAA